MLHILDEDIELHLLRQLPSDREAPLPAHLLSCDACRARLNKAQQHLQSTLLAQTNALRERRRARRIPTDDAGTLSVLNSSKSDPLTIAVLDVSAGGMKVRLNKRIDPLTIVQVALKGTVVTGDIRYCVTVAHGYFHAGICIWEMHPLITH